MKVKNKLSPSWVCASFSVALDSQLCLPLLGSTLSLNVPFPLLSGGLIQGILGAQEMCNGNQASSGYFWFDGLVSKLGVLIDASWIETIVPPLVCPFQVPLPTSQYTLPW